MSMDGAQGPRSLFVLADEGLIVTNAIVDVGVGGIRARLALDVTGALVVVEDLDAACLHDEHERNRFVDELFLREPFGVRACRSGAAPFGVWPYIPGVPFERVFRARMAHGGCAPHAVVVEVGLVAARALARFGRAAQPQESDDISMLVWAGFDGSLSSVPRVRRVSPRTRYEPPGMAAGDARDERTRVYALGVLLHCLLFGVHPLHAPAVDKSQKLEVNDALQELVVRCVQRAPRDRPASLEEVRLGLRRARAETSARADGFVATLFDVDRREQEELAEQARMLSFDGSDDVQLVHSRPLERRMRPGSTRKPPVPLPG